MGRQYVKTPTVYQMEITECGAASLSMILAYYGKHVALEKLRVETGVSRDGCNAKNICTAAEKYGFTARGKHWSCKKLVANAEPPCMLHWNFNHFVVYEGKKGRYYYLNDPALGRRKLSYEELEAGFTGVVLLFTPGPEFKKEKKKPDGLFRFLLARLQGEGGSLRALLLFSFFLAPAAVVTPLFSEVFVDAILLGGNRGWMLGLLLTMIGVTVYTAVLSLGRAKLIRRFQNKLSLVHAYEMVRHMLRMPMNFYEQRYAGDLTQRVVNNNNVSEFLGGDLTELAANLFVAVFLGLVMLLISVPLSLMGFAVTLLQLLFMKYSARAMATRTMKLQQDSGRLIGTAFNGITVSGSLKAVGAENAYVARVLGYYAKLARTEGQIESYQQMLNAIPGTISGVTNVLTLMIGGMQVVDGSLTPGALVAFSGVLAAFNSPVNAMMGFAQKMQSVRTDMARVQDIMHYQEDALYTGGEKREAQGCKLNGRVEFCDVSFGYGRLNPPNVVHASFRVDCGRSVALVGSSGSGKSTLAKLASSLYTPWEGDILFDGKPAAEIAHETLFASISTVSQSITLFSGSIRDNITMFDNAIPEWEVLRAAKDACIHDDITRKPGGYDYVLKENGSNLSGGQRQRLEIAKALVNNPTILIMDEATSALDPVVEAQIMRNIRRRGCTCIIVAQRLSSIRDCDEILLVERGKIAERGDHESLMLLGGKYYQLIQSA